MDYILNHINNDLAICDEDSYEYIVSLRKSVEYSLFLLVGLLWNKNGDSLLIDDRKRIAASFDRMTIGDVVSAITLLDKKKEVLQNKKSRSLIADYPGVRNVKIGHGYALSSDLIGVLTPFYDGLINSISLLKDEHSLIYVEKSDQHQYYGIRIDITGQKSRWVCPKEAFPHEEEFPRTYIQIDNKYHKLSPFITLKRNGVDFQEYVFSTLSDSLTGQIKLCPLFGNTQEEYVIYSEFARYSECDEYREVGMNGTVMNRFECNYQTYQDVGFSKIVWNFLLKNKSNVSATLWGHGGVGKTACIQYVCQQLFCSKEMHFSYIVFVTAKDRIYNPITGKIIQNSSKYVRRYSEIIETVIHTVYPDLVFQFEDGKLQEPEKLIKEYTGKLLIVIDDYETFRDEEKKKISEFLKDLDINHHKVILTTRNLRLSIGTPIPTGELDITATCTFLQGIIDSKCPELSGTLKKELTKRGIPEKVLAATNGRPIFIYQFAYLYMQNGMQDTIFSSLHSGSDAQDFLYGRVFYYLTETAKTVFATIPAVVNDDLLFRFDMLRYVLQKEILDDDKFESAVDELVNQLVIEHYNDTHGRVYAQELLSIMQDRYSHLGEPQKEAIRGLIESLGGKEISVTIEEAMLQEADQSRITGNIEEIIGKYRRVLNLKKCPIKLRRQALVNAASYLTIHDLNPKMASELVYEYLPLFKDDAHIAHQYVEYLWQQEDRKSDAVNFIRQFFSKANGHKKTSPQNLQFFALGTSYCTYYDMNLRSYDSVAKRKMQLSQTINEFGKELFGAIEDKFEKLRPGVKHAVQMGLVQTSKACIEFDAEDIAKLNFGIEICEFSFGRFISHFAIQAKQTHEKLTRKIKLIESQNGGNILNQTNVPLWWDSFIADDYHVGDCVDVVVSGVVPYGVFVSFGESGNYKGLLHISNISHEFLPREHLTTLFHVGQAISVKIMKINIERKRINLALKELL